MNEERTVSLGSGPSAVPRGSSDLGGHWGQPQSLRRSSRGQRNTHLHGTSRGHQLNRRAKFITMICGRPSLLGSVRKIGNKRTVFWLKNFPSWESTLHT